MPMTASPPASPAVWDCNKNIFIVGATSAIAEETARIFARRGARFFLVARNEERLETLAADLNVRGAESVQFAALDVSDFVRHRAVVDEAASQLGTIGVALIAHGTLGDQKACEQDFELAMQELNINAISAMSLLTYVANRMEAQGNGTIAVISSVAGDRGRQSNYIYGTAKAALNVFLQGLRNRLHRSGVNVLTIKPGFVDTPMTKEFKKGLLWATPKAIAEGIVRAIEARKSVTYLPAYWRFIMLVIRAIPEKLFRLLRL